MFARQFSTALRPQRIHSVVCQARRQAHQAAATNNTDHDDSPVLKVEKAAGVLTLTLNRPKQRNALNRSLLEALQYELELASQMPKEIRVIVIQGGHGGSNVFSSGHDLKELASLDKPGQNELLQLCRHVMQLLPSIPQPTIGAVDGVALAAGCQLVAACDLVVGNPMSGYATPGATTIGLFCHTPAVPLVRCIGIKRTMDMLLTGRMITAQEAMDYGLITHIAANPQRAAAKLANEIAAQSACAIQSGKQCLHQHQQAASDTSLEMAYELATKAMLENLQTGDAKAGIESFLQKKSKPEWKHE